MTYISSNDISVFVGQRAYEGGDEPDNDLENTMTNAGFNEICKKEVRDYFESHKPEYDSY